MGSDNIISKIIYKDIDFKLVSSKMDTRSYGKNRFCYTIDI